MMCIRTHPKTPRKGTLVSGWYCSLYSWAPSTEAARDALSYSLVPFLMVVEGPTEATFPLSLLLYFLTLSLLSDKTTGPFSFSLVA